MTGGNWIAGVDDFAGELHGMRDSARKPRHSEERERKRERMRREDRRDGGKERVSE